jgi:signal peptidase
MFISISFCAMDPNETGRKSIKPDEAHEADQVEPVNYKRYAISLMRDILIAVIVMSIIIGSLWLYTGNWPPMVVIESSSMMHGGDSHIDTIDTGDLVLVKDISDRDNIKTYVEGKQSNYKTYGSYGDVIIFRKNGQDDTPVIHRVVVWIEYNESGHHTLNNNNNRIVKNGSFDIPSLGKYNEPVIYIPNYYPNNINLTINLDQILNNFDRLGLKPHSGFLTKGDNNNGIDQSSSLKDAKGRPVEPVKIDWVVGKAEGELPWFGLIKLYVGGETSQPDKTPPPTSVKMLILCITLIVVIPIILDMLFSHLSKRKEEEQDDEHEKEGPGVVRQNGMIQQDKYSQKYKPGRPRGPPDKSSPGVNDGSKYITKDDLLRKIK